MEFFENNNIDEFYREMRESMEKEPGHFREQEFSLEDLTSADRGIWEKIKGGNLSKEEFAEYAEEVRASRIPSRLTFLGLANNKAMGLFLWRDIDSRKKE